ncbi:unnamed protein product, partial [Prunus brigantina]
MTSAIGLHRRWSCIAPWPTTLAMSFGPIARCNGSLGRSCLTRSRWRFAASCRYTNYHLEDLNEESMTGGQNSQRSTYLVKFMFDLGMSWPSPFIRRWWRGTSWFFRSPPPTGCWISDFDADVGSDSREESLVRSGIPIPNFGAQTSEPVHPEHPQQTTAPVDAQTSEPHVV